MEENNQMIFAMATACISSGVDSVEVQYESGSPTVDVYDVRQCRGPQGHVQMGRQRPRIQEKTHGILTSKWVQSNLNLELG